MLVSLIYSVAESQAGDRNVAWEESTPFPSQLTRSCSTFKNFHIGSVCNRNSLIICKLLLFSKINPGPWSEDPVDTQRIANVSSVLSAFEVGARHTTPKTYCSVGSRSMSKLGPLSTAAHADTHHRSIHSLMLGRRSRPCEQRHWSLYSDSESARTVPLRCRGGER